MTTPNYDDVNNLLDLWRETNAATDSLFSYLFLLAVFVISFFAMSMFDRKQVFIASSFVTAIVAMLLFFAGLASMASFVIALILFAASILAHLFGGD